MASRVSYNLMLFSDTSFAEHFDRDAQEYMSTQICDRIRDERRSDDNDLYVRRAQVRQLWWSDCLLLLSAADFEAR